MYIQTLIHHDYRSEYNLRGSPNQWNLVQYPSFSHCSDTQRANEPYRSSPQTHPACLDTDVILHTHRYNPYCPSHSSLLVPLPTHASAHYPHLQHSHTHLNFPNCHLSAPTPNCTGPSSTITSSSSSTIRGATQTRAA
jgi:hypothetical protein